MRRILASVVAALAMIAGLVGVVAVENVAAAAADVHFFTASLAATNEVPPNASGYTGSVLVTVNTATLQVCATATTNVPGSDPITAQHIHQAAAGVNGPIVVPFASLDDCAVSTAPIVNGIVADPSGFYYNVHTTTFPGGALRGQLEAVASVTFTPSLAATNEVPPNATGYTGSAVITVYPSIFEVCVDATTNVPGSDPITAQHIHQAAAGVNGPIVVPFPALNACVVSDATTVNNIVANPSGFYFNVHTEAFPGGALRGQLAAAPAPPVEEIVVVTPTFTG